MKNPLVIATIALCSLLCSSSNIYAQSASVAAGDLIYVHIADSTYQVFLKLYQDCSATSAPDSVPLCISNSCTTTVISMKMGKFSNSTTTNTGCSNVKTSCDSAGSLVTGYRETFYGRIVTLPYRCNSWKFATYIQNRNNITNIVNNTSQALYLEATLNNTNALDISSPYYPIKPQIYARQNEQYSFNSYALDADGDSTWTSIITPMTGVTSCGDTAKNITFPSVSPPYNLVTNPIQTNNTFTFASSTGQMTFTPQFTGVSNIAMRTNKYRNGVLIGSVMREIQVNSLPDSGAKDTITSFNCGGQGPPSSNGIIYGCAGSQLNFCFGVRSTNPNGKLKVSDNLAVSIPGATLNYQNQGTDSVICNFSWTPTVNDVGPSSCSFIITDSTCQFPGLIKQFPRVIDFFIWGETKASTDTSICGGSSIYLNVGGGGNYVWTVLPGGDNTSLSNPNIPNPVATPDRTTTYVVTSTVNTYCPNMNKDTVTISVDNPIINITSNKNNINYGDTVTFTAAISNCDSPTYQWMIDGIAIQGETYSTFSTATLFDQQNVTCKLNCTNNCSNSKTRISNVITMNVATQQNSNNYAAGGELLYVHISGTTYQYFFKMYRDCFSAAAPDSVPVCFYNPCNASGFTIQMPKWSGSLPPGNLGPNCPNYKSACDSIGSTIPGYSEHWYSSIVNLPIRCNSWKTFVSINTRNYSYNLDSATTKSLFIEATLNNSLSFSNSSPFYSVKPFVFLPQGRQITYNSGALDADGDSLVTELIAPQSGSANCNYSPTPIAFNNAQPAFNLINNPFQTGNSFYMNNKTGMMSFKATTLGKANIAIRTTEYRNGIEIGSVTRDIQTLTLENATGSATITREYGCNTLNITNDTVRGCAGETISFCFNTKSSDSDALIRLSHNFAVSIPNASIQFTNQGTDSVYATFSWTTSASDTGLHTGIVILSDSSCRPPGYIVQEIYPLYIHISGATKAIDDTTICPGSSVQLSATGGGKYLWSIYYGGQAGVYLDSINAKPVVNPTINTTYTVQSLTSSHCPNNSDTVIVSMLPATAIAKPTIAISASPSNTINNGDTVTFTATSSGCNSDEYQWMINGNNIPGANQNSYTTSSASSGDVYSCNYTCNDICSIPKDTISNTITMLVFPTSIDKLNASNGINIYPNPNRGVFTVKINDVALTETNKIEIINTLGQKVYSATFNGHKTEIKLGYITTGTYTLKISNNKNTYVGKIILAE